MSWDGVLILAQQQGPDGGGVANAIGAVIYLAIVITMFAGLWKTFEKAGEPGWGVLIPFYNIYLLCKIAGRPGWWLLLLLIPCVNFIVGIIIGLDIAKNFGKGTMFGIGLALLAFIFYPILGFGDARVISARKRPACRTFEGEPAVI